MSIRYEAIGEVYGKAWGGSYGLYPAEKVEAESLEELRKEIENGIKEGWLDSGFGFEYLKGAIMEIITIETRIIDGKEFVHKDFSIEVFGEVPEEALKKWLNG